MVPFEEMSQQGSASDVLRDSEGSLGMALLEIIFDEDGKPNDYRYIDINPSYGRYIGQAPQFVIGKTYRELNVGSLSVWLNEYGDVALTGIPKRGEIVIGERHYEIYAYSPQKGHVANLKIGRAHV